MQFFEVNLTVTQLLLIWQTSDLEDLVTHISDGVFPAVELAVSFKKWDLYL